MKRITILLALALVVALTLPVAAEVEEITAGGSIQIRGQIQESGTTSVATPIPQTTISSRVTIFALALRSFSMAILLVGSPLPKSSSTAIVIRGWIFLISSFFILALFPF